ncbi:hypothetical protein V8E51_001866 [Hyaloscypha variabilis]|jgi:hypothetical protein
MDVLAANLTANQIIETILQTQHIDQTNIRPQTIIYATIFWLLVLRVNCLIYMTDQGQREFAEEGMIWDLKAEEEREVNGMVEFGEREWEMCGYVVVVLGLAWGLEMFG